MSKEPDWNKSKVIHSAFSFFINEETKRTLSFFSRSWWRCSYDYLVTHIFFSQLWINLKIKQSASKRKGPWGLLKIKVPCLLVEGVSLTFVVPRQYFPRSTDGKIWQHWKFLLPRTNSNKMLIMKTCQGQDVKWGQLDTFELKQYLKKIDNETTHRSMMTMERNKFNCEILTPASLSSHEGLTSLPYLYK